MIASACATAAWRFSRPVCTTLPRSSTVYREDVVQGADFRFYIARGTAKSTMNMGRWRRALTTRSTRPRPMIGSDEAVQETMMSNCGQLLRQFSQPYGAPVKR